MIGISYKVIVINLLKTIKSYNYTRIIIFITIKNIINIQNSIIFRTHKQQNYLEMKKFYIIIKHQYRLLYSIVGHSTWLVVTINGI